VIDPSKVALFIPPGLRKFKLDLFERIGAKIGRVVRHDFAALERLPDEITPIVGCSPELTQMIAGWRSRGRRWVYWDRGYCRRIFATDLPYGANGGMYRWHIGSFQLQAIGEFSDDRWRALKTDALPWRVNPNGHVVVADPSPTYQRFHGIEGWLDRTVAALREVTDRKIVVRDKEMQRNAIDRRPGGRRLWEDIREAHCLVTHGSNAAVEAVIMGCPVFVHPDSAAALVGLTDLNQIEKPIYPDRELWLNSLAYSQFSEAELVDGTLWRLLR
jgi:hypothetical protein